MLLEFAPYLLAENNAATSSLIAAVEAIKNDTSLHLIA
jgi:hypothetical protein